MVAYIDVSKNVISIFLSLCINIFILFSSNAFMILLSASVNLVLKSWNGQVKTMSLKSHSKVLSRTSGQNGVFLVVLVHLSLCYII